MLCIRTRHCCPSVLEDFYYQFTCVMRDMNRLTGVRCIVRVFVDEVSEFWKVRVSAAAAASVSFAQSVIVSECDRAVSSTTLVFSLYVFIRHATRPASFCQLQFKSLLFS